ncbi:hypothetical protein ACFFSW_32490 [Saccharothrix longispora]|uniref:Mce-associated membrane protein n=1 Tax=Saccharothrix longispora TaxID=33920 RepID=A0ABU1Q1U8_9PSEU|nr:hypothetical protein [Saccharothrix longispora]MDR6596870.1 Mce-associated membrane protein [Saccharothrix longispora]
MPPSRRRPVPSTPTGGRPRVAGLRKRPEHVGQRADDTARTDAAVTDAAVTEGNAVDDTAADLAPGQPADGTDDHPAEASTRVLGLIEPGDGADEDGTGGGPPEPAPRPRPTGRRKRAGDAVAASVLDDVPGAGETGRGTGDRSRRDGLLLPVSLVVLAALLVGLGVLFQVRAGEVRYDRALVDSAGTAEVAGQTREAVEKAFSYNFADVAATEDAANELLVGKAKCQYNAIFGPVRALAPEQKLVVTVKAVSSGVTSLSGDRATVLLFVDQVTTRTTDNQSGGGIAMMRVGAQRVDGRWKVDNMEMFGQSGDQAAETAQC